MRRVLRKSGAASQALLNLESHRLRPIATHFDLLGDGNDICGRKDGPGIVRLLLNQHGSKARSEIYCLRASKGEGKVEKGGGEKT